MVRNAAASSGGGVHNMGETTFETAAVFRGNNAAVSKRWSIIQYNACGSRLLCCTDGTHVISNAPSRARFPSSSQA